MINTVSIGGFIAGIKLKFSISCDGCNVEHEMIHIHASAIRFKLAKDFAWENKLDSETNEIVDLCPTCKNKPR